MGQRYASIPSHTSPHPLSEGDKRSKAEALVAELPGKPMLPSVTHAPGFEKYSLVEAGGCAHEAGYDAFMTGVAFANLLPLTQVGGGGQRAVGGGETGCGAGWDRSCGEERRGALQLTQVGGGGCRDRLRSRVGAEPRRRGGEERSS